MRQNVKMKYEVIIDFESCHLEVEAESELEANKKGYEEYLKLKQDGEFPECWVGETQEEKE